MNTIFVVESSIDPIRTSSFIKTPEYFTPIWTYKKRTNWGMLLVVGIVAAIAVTAGLKHYGVL